MNIPNIKLKNGSEIPALGLGTWKAEPGEVGEAIISALKVGYRHFDCAAIYGNEKEIGDAFARAFKEDLVKREDIWVTSKLWCDCHEKEQVMPALRQTLSDLKFAYLDLYLVHWSIALKHGKTFPEEAGNFLKPADAPLAETWAGMVECHREGLASHIGVSNVSAARLETLISAADHAPEVNQVECHPFLTQKELLDVCDKHGVVLTGYCPLGSGKSKDGNTPNLFKNETMAKIAKNHAATTAQIALAWAICRGTVPIPKSTNEKRQKENLAAAGIRLSDEEIAEIDALDQGYRYIDGTIWTDNDSAYSLEWLWAGGAID